MAPTPTPTPAPRTPDVTAAQIAACVPALQAWASAEAAAQIALQRYLAELTTVQQSLARSLTAAAPSSTTAAPAPAKPATTAPAVAPAKPTTAKPSTTTTNPTTPVAAATTPAAATKSPAAPAATTSPEALQARLLGDQATITATEQALSVAQQNLVGATLTAPISGVVGQVGLTPGEGETSSQGITIVGGGAATVTVQVPLANLPALRTGESATVAPAGLSPTTGAVNRISLLPTSSTASPPTYAVTVLLPEAPQALATGSTVSTSIVTATAADVVTLPVSALSGRAAGSAGVNVLRAGQLTPVQITVGAVGGGLVEVMGGLAQGDEVVIATVSDPLPTNQSQNVRGLTGGGGGGGGGTRPGGGGARPGG